MNMKLVAMLGVALLTLSTGALAGDAAAGKTKAAGCAGCHGLTGVSNNPMYPSLAAQKEKYLVKAMKDYRDGHRKDPMMDAMAKSLTDADIDDLAAFYSSQKP